jgi:hypothetical protein
MLTPILPYVAAGYYQLRKDCFQPMGD